MNSPAQALESRQLTDGFFDVILSFSSWLAHSFLAALALLSPRLTKDRSLFPALIAAWMM
ncbi:hypothetical protein ACWKW1_10275 [Brevibacillus parabrevis]